MDITDGALYQGALNALAHFSKAPSISGLCRHEPEAVLHVSFLLSCLNADHLHSRQAFLQASRAAHGEAVVNTLQLLNAAAEAAGGLQHLPPSRAISSILILIGTLHARISTCAQHQALTPATGPEPTELLFYQDLFQANNAGSVLASLAAQLVTALQCQPQHQPEPAAPSTAPQQPQPRRQGSAKKHSKMQRQERQQQKQQQGHKKTARKPSTDSNLWHLAAAVLELFTVVMDTFKLQPLPSDSSALSQLLPFVSLSLLLLQHAAAEQEEQSNSANNNSKLSMNRSTSSTTSSTNSSTRRSTDNSSTSRANSSTHSTNISSSSSSTRSSTDNSSADDGPRAWWTADFDKHRARGFGGRHFNTHLAMRVAVYMAAQLDALTQYRDPDAPMPLRIPAMLVQSTDLQQLLLVFFALAVQQADQQHRQQQQAGLASNTVHPDHAALLEALGVAGLVGGSSFNPFVGFEAVLQHWSQRATVDPVQDLLALAALTCQFSTDHEIASVLATASWPPQPPCLPPYLPLPRLEAVALPLLLTLIEAAELSGKEHRALLLLSLCRPSGDTLVSEALAMCSRKPPICAPLGLWTPNAQDISKLPEQLQQQLHQPAWAQQQQQVRSRPQPAAAADASKHQAGSSGGPQLAAGVGVVADALMLRLTPVLHAHLHSKARPYAAPGIGRAAIARASIQLYRPLFMDASYASLRLAASAAFCKLPSANAAVLESCLRATSLPEDYSSPHLRRLLAHCNQATPKACSNLVLRAVAAQNAGSTALDPAVGVALCGLLTSSLKFQSGADAADLMGLSDRLTTAAKTALAAVRALEPGFDPCSAPKWQLSSMRGLPSHLHKASSSGGGSRDSSASSDANSSSSNCSASSDANNSSSGGSHRSSGRKIEDTNMVHAWLVVLGRALQTTCSSLLVLLDGCSVSVLAMMLWSNVDSALVIRAAVEWLGLALQQLQLPGEPAAAAAVLQELQQQQVQVQMLSMSFAELQQLRQSEGQPGDVIKSRCHMASERTFNREALLAGQQFAAALCSALPVPLWCSYLGCDSTRRLSERNLVHSGLCAGCKTAKYCSSTCQALHWKEGHKAACKRLRPQKPGNTTSAGSAPRSG